MLRKLKVKFILTNMLLVALVLLCVFGMLFYSTARQAEADSISAMEMSLRWRGDSPSPFEFSMPPDRRGPDSRFIIPAFSVEVDANGSVLDVFSRNDVKVSDEVLSEAVSQVMASSTRLGKLPELGLRYLMRYDNGEFHIAFSDLEWERATLTRLIITSLLVGLGRLCCFSL
jgi:hypothetical protein